ncbi:hypothetical protein [Ruminococcus sp.]|uniref:hypothetical protein n=1 Tax=Ruminococcus sp. TaxID=41978 RepID=UPI00386616E8
MTEEEKRINDEESAYLEEQLADIDVDSIQLTPAIRPYSHQRIRQFLRDNGIDMQPYFRGYKNASRYLHHQQWLLVNMSDNTIIGSPSGHTLYELRVYLSNMGVPLHGDNYKPPTVTKSGRRIACDKFLEAVEAAESVKKGGQSNG